MRKTVAVLGVCLGALMAVPAMAQPYIAGTDHARQDLEFRRGQRWSYHARAEDAGSTVLVLKSENLPGVGKVVHVAVAEVALGGERRSISYLAMSPEALRRSVTTLDEMTTHLPQVDADYREWRTAAEKGDVQPFTVQLADIIAVISDQIAPAAGNDGGR